MHKLVGWGFLLTPMQEYRFFSSPSHRILCSIKIGLLILISFTSPFNFICVPENQRFAVLHLSPVASIYSKNENVPAKLSMSFINWMSDQI